LRAVKDVPASQFGAATAKVPAEAMKGRRVTVSGEVQARGAAGGASLWLQIDRDTSTLMLDDGMAQPLRGDVEWTRRSVSLPVPDEATGIVFGVSLQGNGSVAVRGLRLEVDRRLPPRSAG
jgi:hypothetical protein